LYVNLSLDMEFRVQKSQRPLLVRMRESSIFAAEGLNYGRVQG
jgi:hypothetical protein